MDHVLYCPRCGNAMTVAPVHVRTTLACPHCDYSFRPAAITRISDSERAPIPEDAFSSAVEDIPPDSPFVPRSRVAAGLLGIFLGCFGAHRFYLGYNGIGAIQLGLTLAGFLVPPVLCCMPLVALWGFVEGIFCLLGWIHDAQGRPLVA